MKQEEIWRLGNARAMRAWVMRCEGKTFREIARTFNVCNERARYLAYRGERIFQIKERVAERKRERDKWERTLRLKPEFVKV